jgi:hypothetical protein
VVAAVLIGDFRPFFGDTCTILHAIYPGMEALTQDNDELSFITLGAATLNVVRYLELCEQKQPDHEGNSPDESQERDKTADHDKAVEQGLRRIERFERRYRRMD